MAIVSLNQNIIHHIAEQAGFIVGQSFKDLPYYPDYAEPGVADEAFDLVLPKETEAQIRALMPPGSMPERSGIYIGLRVDHDGAQAEHRIVANFEKPRIHLSGAGEIKNLPGIELINWRSNGMLIVPAKEGVIQPPKLRACVKEILDISQKWEKRNAAVRKATADMSLFLSQYRTVQQAMKAFGPALAEYLPYDIKELMEAPAIKRPRRPKAEPIEVDIKHLIAHATAHKLQLNS